ncbi:hypothetical protein TNCV_4881971 [Trichonephila clavipes]|nr:hypothetical protein TNCV_4881971 [Trichonephila clavipes]
MYREKYSQRDTPNHRMIANSNHRLCECGSGRGNRRTEVGSRRTRTPSMDQNVLNTVRRIRVVIYKTSMLP